jgi:hypothetical protein
MPTPDEIRTIANTGTDQQVAALYFELTGTNIKGCIPCQRKDARIELKIMAKKASQGETFYSDPVVSPEPQTSVGGYILNKKYTSRPTYIFDRLVQLRDETDLKFWLARMPAVLVKIEATPTPEPVTPATDDTTQDNAITIHGE